MKPFPCKTVNRAQKNKTGKIEIFRKCRTQERGRMVSCTGCREWYHEECMPISKQVWQKIQNISGTVTTAKYSRVCSINLYMCLLINTCVHLDMLNMGIQWGYNIH